MAKISATSAAPGIAISQGRKKSWFLRLGDHQAPGEERRLHAEAEEGQRRLEQDRMSELDRGHDDQRAQ